MRTDADLTKLVNQSGFPLQIAIDHVVTTNSERLGWRVLYREHGWKSPDGQTGFLDLVLEDNAGSSVLAVECKRVQESDWIFLDTTLPTEPKSRRVRLWATNTGNHGKAHAAYFDARCYPESWESMFCVVPGQDSKSRPMLERTAAEVTAATEALAMEEYPLVTQRGYGLRVYASVILTTARLVHAKVDPSKIDATTGELSEAKHNTVPWIRFRKQLAPDRIVSLRDTAWDFASVAAEKEKQVFIVSAAALPEFLATWRLVSNSFHRLM